MTLKSEWRTWSEKFGALLAHWANDNIGATENDDEILVKTTRYLRLSMVALVVGLGSAVLYAHLAPRKDGGVNGSCWQTSISAYYYTPAQSFVVAALVAVGISLIALKGNTEVEDVLLNFAGMFAPLVAFVPTPGTGSCGTVIDATNRNFNIDNNVVAVLIMAGAAFVVLAVLYLRGTSINDSTAPGQKRRRQDQSAPKRRAQAIQTGGYIGALVLYGLTWFLYIQETRWFKDNAHSFSAVIFFVFIFLTVLDNAINFHFARKRIVARQKATTAPEDRINSADLVKPAKPINRYLLIAILMAVAVIVIKEAPWFGDYETIWLEATMITLFAIFWVFQTHELWYRGLRTSKRSAGIAPSSAPTSALILIAADDLPPLIDPQTNQPPQQ